MAERTYRFAIAIGGRDVWCIILYEPLLDREYILYLLPSKGIARAIDRWEKYL